MFSGTVDDSTSTEEFVVADSGTNPTASSPSIILNTRDAAPEPPTLEPPTLYEQVKRYPKVKVKSKHSYSKCKKKGCKWCKVKDMCPGYIGSHYFISNESAIKTLDVHEGNFKRLSVNGCPIQLSNRTIRDSIHQSKRDLTSRSFKRFSKDGFKEIIMLDKLKYINGVKPQGSVVSSICLSKDHRACNLSEVLFNPLISNIGTSHPVHVDISVIVLKIFNGCYPGEACYNILQMNSQPVFPDHQTTLSLRWRGPLKEEFSRYKRDEYIYLLFMVNPKEYKDSFSILEAPSQDITIVV